MSNQMRPPSVACPAGNCYAAKHAYHEILSCSVQNGSNCSPGRLVEAGLSKFHDSRLIEATERINDILDSIPPDESGRSLALLNTKRGILLAWVYHENRPEGNYSIGVHEDEAIKALKLKG